MNRVWNIVILIVAAATLAACSSMRHGAAAGQMGVGASAYGIGGRAGFQSENSPYRLKAPYNQTYHFDFDKSMVRDADLASIRVQANYLIAHPTARVRLEGNTDERGSREYNIGLGWRRAQAVAMILKEAGVSPQQIVMISYGEERPVATGHNEAAWSLNRRTDLIYEAK